MQALVESDDGHLYTLEENGTVTDTPDGVETMVIGQASTLRTFAEVVQNDIDERGG